MEIDENDIKIILDTANVYVDGYSSLKVMHFIQYAVKFIEVLVIYYG